MKNSLSLALGLLVLPSVSAAQVVLRTQYGVDQNINIGLRLEGFADITGDNVPDYALGMRTDPANGYDAGSVSFFSGADGSLIRQVFGDGPSEFFGGGVTDVGDVDNDGWPDVAVRASVLSGAAFAQPGSVRVFSGDDGTELLRLDGTQNFDRLGRAVCGLGDVNSDGHDDFVVSAEHWDFGSQGRLHIVSGIDGTFLATRLGPFGSQLGQLLSPAGDANGDLVPDFATSAHNRERVQLRSGVDGSVIRTIILASECAPSSSMSAEADVDGDGVNDLIVGSFVTNSETGAVCVYSGASGSLLYRLDGEAGGAHQFGIAVEGLDDLDGDGRDDFGVTAHGGFSFPAAPTELFVYSGTGDLLYRVIPAGIQGGIDLAALPDIDGDGRTDILFDHPIEDYPAQNHYGTFRILSGLRSVGTTTACTAVANSTGAPASLAIFGPDFVGPDHLHLRATSLPTNQFGYMLASQTTATVQQPPGSQGVLCLGGTIGRFVAQVASTGSAGQLLAVVDLAAMPPPLQAVQAGQSWTFQAWYRDFNPTPTSNFSDAVTVDFQ